MSDASMDLVGITNIARSPWATYDETTQNLQASITTVNFLDRTDPITQGIETSDDGGETWNTLMSQPYSCPPRVNRHGVIPGTFAISGSVSVDHQMLYRSFVDPMGVALTTTVEISQQ